MWEEKTDYRTGEKYYYNILTSERRSLAPDNSKYGKVVVEDQEVVILHNNSKSGGGTDTTYASSTTTPNNKRTGGSRQAYAYYTGEYKAAKSRQEESKKDKMKKKNKNKKKKKHKYSKSRYPDDANDDSDEESSYGDWIPQDSYSSDEEEDDKEDKRRAPKRHRKEKKSEKSKTRKSSSKRKMEESSKRKKKKKSNRYQDDSSSSSNSEPEPDDRRHRRSKSKSKTTSSSSSRQHRREKESNAAQVAAVTSTVRSQLEAQRQEIEARKQELQAKEQAIAKERQAMLERRAAEEKERQDQLALEEQARREQFEKEYAQRQAALQAETERQVQQAQLEAQRIAREAEEARRQAHEEAEAVRQQAAALERERQVQAAQQAEEVARIRHQALQQQKLHESQRLALMEEQRKIQEELQRQDEAEGKVARTQSTIAPPQRIPDDEGDSNEDSDDDDDDEENESSSEYSSDDDDDSSSSSSEDPSISEPGEMEESMDLNEIVKNRPPTARDKKRQLEKKFAAATGSSTTANNTTASTLNMSARANGSTLQEREAQPYGNPQAQERTIVVSPTPRRSASPGPGSRSVSPGPGSRSASPGPGHMGRTQSGRGLGPGQMTRVHSGRGLGPTQRSMPRPGLVDNRTPSGRGMNRAMSSGRGGMPRQASARPGPGPRGMSRSGSAHAMNMSRANSSHALHMSAHSAKNNANGLGNESYAMYDDEEYYDDNTPKRPPMVPQKSKKVGKKDDFERPPKSLVLIWLVVAGELGFDLGTTIIAFRSLLEEDDCCGYEISLGPIPMTVTAPFFLLVAAELAMLLRAILLTLFPNMMNAPDDQFDDEGNIITRSTFMSFLCCCLRWKVRVIMRFLGLLVLLNPFFGCVIAWILLYQSDKKEGFMVLGFEAGSLTLHYISVCLEGAITNCWEFILHGLVPLVPFLVSIGVTLVYLKQTGVCYLVNDSLFMFNGCEVCDDGYPPVNGTCHFRNGTTYPFVPDNVFDFSQYRSLENIVGATYQVSYCAEDNPEGPQDVNFCFFDYDEGKLEGTVTNETQAPTPVPIISNNKCGATVSPGARLVQCNRYIWQPTDDVSIHCRTMGGPGDSCQLSIENDGQNEGRFKDPSGCGLELGDGNYRAYGDSFFLWDEPPTYDKDYVWAGNSWLAYSTSRFPDQVTAMREGGVEIVSPSVIFSSSSQVQDDFQMFFDSCQPNCVTVGDVSYVDILAMSVYCDPDEELCATKVDEAVEAAKTVSEQYDNRPVYVTSFGVLDTQSPSKLSRAMVATSNFFSDGSPVQRVYWYGGSQPDATNLSFQAAEGAESSLGNVWARTCRDLN